VYVDFTGRANGSISGLVPDVGPALTTTGAQPPTIVSGKAASSGTGYIFATTGTVPQDLWSDVVFTGPTNTGVMTMAFSDSAINNAVHFNYGAKGYSLTVRKDGGTFDSLPGGAGSWVRPVPADGATVARVRLILRGNTLTIVGPNGENRKINDPRIGLLAGAQVFWEPNNDGTNAALMLRGGVHTLNTTVQPSQFPAFADLGGEFLIDQDARVVGGAGTAFEVAIGRDNASGTPSIEFGSHYGYSIALTSAAASSATSIVTDKYIPNGSTIVLESGSGSETVTASANSTGSGPYTTTVSALTKAHAAGVGGSAIPPSGFRAIITLLNGAFNIPTLIATGHIYLAGQTAEINQPTSGVVGTAGLGAGKGAFRAATTTTAGRPTPAQVGAGSQMYDTTLSKPIWSDGTTWRDAAGTAV
jgi:hypothetical protein